MEKRLLFDRLSHLNWGTLAAFVLICILLWAFIDLADDVMAGDVQAFDERVVLAMREQADLSDPLGPAWFEEMMRDATGLGGVGVLTFITLVTFGYLMYEHKYKLALLVVCAIGTGILLSFLMKSGFTRARPELVPHGSHVYTSSFPSGHSMMSALVYLTLASLLVRVQKRRRVKIYLFAVAIALTLIIGSSRVYLGVHWPTDVFAGWMAGALWAALFYIVGSVLQITGVVEEAGVEPELEEPEDTLVPSKEKQREEGAPAPGQGNLPPVARSAEPARPDGP